VTVVVNGRSVSLAEGARVADAAAAAGVRDDRKGVAVALNGEVVPRSRWHEQRLAPDDRVEVLSAIGGG
jgi:sulfur carrier protein